MTTFDSTKRSLPNLLRDIQEGKIQLPDFQRGWVWDDDHVQSLLVSVARSFPVGAIMLMETGGECKRRPKPAVICRGPDGGNSRRWAYVIGASRKNGAVALKTPVSTRTAKDKPILRHYYFHIPTALEGAERLEDAVVAVDETRQQRSNFGRDVDLDLSTRELECEQLYFPCDSVLEWSGWLQDLNRVNPQRMSEFLTFQREVLAAFNDYHLPVIELGRETSKEAVCLVFEKVNTGGVQLSVFELITASYAADGYNLRDDWFGSDIRDVESRQARIAQDELLESVESTDFLQAVTLLYTRERKRQDIREGKQGKQVRPVSAKRASVLELPLHAFQQWADAIERGFRQAGRFLRKECFYGKREVPYRTQIVPLAAVMTLLGDRWLEPRIYDKLARWFWSGVLGELYGGAVETRIAVDLEELMAWFEDDAAVPRTVTDASFQPERLDSLRTRLSAAYKGINVLVLREGARDFFWKAGIQELDAQEVALDIHHIFPRAWCEQQGIPPAQYDSLINKTSISYKANRKIGGDAPSEYLRRLQADKQVQLPDGEMDSILHSHRIPADRLRADDFDAFVDERRRLLLGLIEKAMGKPVRVEG